MYMMVRRVVVLATTAALSCGFRRAPRLLAGERGASRTALKSGGEVAVYDEVFELCDLEALDVASADASHRAFSRRGGVGTILEAALDSFLAELGDESPFVEYWSRDVWKHIEAHADVDEALAKETGALRFPDHGHVLGLSVGPEARGPTCVFSRDGASLTTAPAVPGRVVRFSGDLEHAVPRPHDVWARSFVRATPSTAANRRSVVLFNTWREPPKDVPLEPDYALPFGESPVKARPRGAWLPAPCGVAGEGAADVVLKVPRLGDAKRRNGAPRHFEATTTPGALAALEAEAAVHRVALARSSS